MERGFLGRIVKDTKEDERRERERPKKPEELVCS